MVVALGSRWRHGLGVVVGFAVYLGAVAPAHATLWLQGASETILVQELAPVRGDTLVVSNQGAGPAAVYVFDNPGGIHVTAPCVLVSPTRGHCPARDRTEIIVRLGGGDNRLAPELGSAIGSGYDLQRFDADAGNGRDRLDLSGARLPPTVLQASTMGGGGADTLLAGRADDDFQTGGLGRDFVVGSSGPDKQRGSDGPDVLLGGGGRDEMRAGSGNDRLFGGGARDRMFGENDNDLLLGGAGVDLFNGGTGRDRVGGGVLPAEERSARGVEVFR